MTAARILNQAQAEAVYNAMCALNNVGAAIDCLLPLGGGKAVRVYEALNASVHVATEAGGRAWQSVERHESQSAFSTAYGLNINEAPVEPAAQSKCPGGAACGWDEKAKMGDICRVCGEQVPF